MPRKFPRFGLAVGVISLIAAIANLAFFFWKLGFSFLALGPMAFCGALVAFSHGSWRTASIAGFLSLCSSVLAGTRARTLESWQLALWCGAVAIVLLLGGWLWANYRKDRNLEKRPLLAAWLARMQRGLGVLLGATGLTIGLVAWLEFDLASCSFFSGHLAEEFTSIGGEAFFLAPIAFLLGVTTIGCGVWRLGSFATCVSLGALVALAHALYSPADAAFFMLTFPLFLFFLPVTLPPFHPLYNPWIAAIFAVILFVTWIARRRRNQTQ